MWFGISYVTASCLIRQVGPGDLLLHDSDGAAPTIFPFTHRSPPTSYGPPKKTWIDRPTLGSSLASVSTSLRFF